jgi:hypothetical protein
MPESTSANGQIGRELNDYIEKVYDGVSLSQIQHLEVSQAFLAGSLITLGLIQEFTSTQTEDEAVKSVSTIQADALAGLKNLALLSKTLSAAQKGVAQP